MDCGTYWRVVFDINNHSKKLILAAADCAEGIEGSLPPPELVLAWQIERWGASSVMSGELPANLLKRMTAVSNTFNAFESFKAGSARFADWATSHPFYFNIVAEVREMRKDA